MIVIFVFEERRDDKILDKEIDLKKGWESSLGFVKKIMFFLCFVRLLFRGKVVLRVGLWGIGGFGRSRREVECFFCF